MSRRFAQVDVFSADPIGGNPVAVVVDAEGVTDEQMAAFARWTNLSETTFLLPPAHNDADYRLRIFTPGGELPFAGHPTLGSAHAWLEAGNTAKGEHLVQECGVGLVTVRDDGHTLAFAAPPLSRSGPVDEDTVAAVRAGLRLEPAEVLGAHWVVNGPNWMVLELPSPDRVLDLEPDMAALGGQPVGVVARYDGGKPGESEVAYEVRAFVPGLGVPEDPVTGSLNAGIAVWLRDAGQAESYVAAQGTALGRTGRVHVTYTDTGIWVGGVTTTIVAGTVAL